MNYINFIIQVRYSIIIELFSDNMQDNEYKHKHELKFWARNVEREKTLRQMSGGAPYDKFYINDFNFTYDDYIDKNILDIGCGPRGSLEWADMANLRVGLDPLVNEYFKLDGGTLFHKMHYVRGYSEDMPFPDETFDFVFSINSLDHVDDLDDTISEMKRVLKVGGICGIIVDTNHMPTPTEPITIDLNLKDKFLDVFEVLDEKVIETVYKTGFRQNLDDPTFYDFNNEKVRPAILLLKFRKVKKFVGETSKKTAVDANTFNSLFEENKKLKEEIEELKNKKPETDGSASDNLFPENQRLKEEIKDLKNEVKAFVKMVNKLK